MKKIYKVVAVTTLMIALNQVYGALIPTGNDNFYYGMGGGNDIPMPAYLDTNTIKIRAEGNIGLGYNCGVFNPTLSIANSLNNIKNSFQNLSQTVVQNATASIAEFPMYMIARANPTLYDLLNNGLLGARDDLSISTKSCEVMQNQIGSGQNPYTDWGTFALGDDWKYHMSLSGSSGTNLFGDSSSGDINQVKQTVQSDNGKNGVSWVQGTSTRGGTYAGGVGQPVIQVIHDTVIAGYNTTLQSGRGINDTSAPPLTTGNDHLVSTWRSPLIASAWIANVVGDYTITTYNGGEKNSIAGVGLLPETQTLTQTITQNLMNLVSGTDEMSIENLQAVSAPRVMVNEAVINAIRAETPVMQSILISKIAQQAATAKVIDEALLARQLLQSGSQVPAIYGNSAAQDDIEKSIKRLDKAIDDLLFNVRVNRELVSNTVSDLLDNAHSQAIAKSLLQSNASNPTMQNGAINTQGGN
jgi:integrating conjugative element protein (TIGR03755 family)